MAGVLRVGTSGFSYAGWTPRFYPPGLPVPRRLAFYAERLSAVELNATFYRRPSEQQLATWASATPPGFRFVVKAQRGATWRAFRSPDPSASLAWLTEPLVGAGDRLGAVLLRVPDDMDRDAVRLATVLDAWPRGIPLVVEARRPSWRDDAIFELLARHGAALCATDQDDADPPDLRVTGPLLYLRLRRTAYTPEAVETWADRLEPFLAAGLDAYAFLRHDADGTSAEVAAKLAAAMAERLGRHGG